MIKNLLWVGLLCLAYQYSQAQTPVVTDGLMMTDKNLCTGFFYGKDSWKNYWEGTLKRSNPNIGTVSTQNITWMGAYGVNKKLTVLAILPYVWTNASGGTLHGMQGLQDVTFAAKYRFLNRAWEGGKLQFFAYGAVSLPASNYTPDFLPLSIGLGSKNLSGRYTATYALKNVWRFAASGAYTWRSHIFLDRSSYYTNGQLYYSNEVQMFDTFDYILRAGYHPGKWHAEVFYTQQNTLGGGDIRRQDMPFASNRMNFSKVGVSLLLDVPHVHNLTARAWGSYTVAGRNVGQSTSVMVGLLYNIPFVNAQSNSK